MLENSGYRCHKYGVDKDVITQLQLARIIDPYGPTGGWLSLLMGTCASWKSEGTGGKHQ